MPTFPSLQNDLLLRAARGATTERTPVWIMRQAGRYLPEYRALREQHDFFEVVRTPELATEVTLQPIERFPLDGAIIFSDILVIPQALGLEVQMVKGRGPVFPDPLDGPDDLDRLADPAAAPEALHYVMDALTVTRQELDGRVPLIGFTGAPWTLMAYMIEGGGSKSFKAAREWLYADPEAAHSLLRTITEANLHYLTAQAEAGAQLLQVFDSWAGLLGPQTFREFALPYLEQIATHLHETHPDVPTIVFAKGAPYALEALAASDYDVISLDWTMDPQAARETVGQRATLQGNLDPCGLYAPPETIQRNVQDMLAGFGAHRHIANLGHGMLPNHDPEHARVFIETVQSVSAEMSTTSTA